MRFNEDYAAYCLRCELEIIQERLDALEDDLAKQLLEALGE